jgi:hypothetical protein
VIRPEVREVVALGALPAEDVAEQQDLEHRERLVRAITRPVTDDEARALLAVFGPDDCYGLAWTVLHLIETAPGWPLEDAPARGQGHGPHGPRPRAPPPAHRPTPPSAVAGAAPSMRRTRWFPASAT